MNSQLKLLALVGVLIAAGCQYPLPHGYVQVDPRGDERVRAVSAADSAITLRTETNPKNGDLAFWETAIKARLVEVRGYHLTEQREVNNHGTKGMEMRYDYNRQGKDYTYLLTVFVKGDRVHVFEAAGVQDRMTADLAGIQKAIQSWPL